jgi:exonuclease III
MRIVSWNCGGGLRKKVDRLDALAADIVIVQECENPEHHAQFYRDWAGDCLWTGHNKNKGLGVFSKTGIKLTPLNWNGSFEIQGFRAQHPAHRWSTEELELFLPFRVNDEFNVLAVWTKSAEVFRYIGQFWKYLQIHHKDLMSSNVMIIGDFNSNTIWDKSGRWWNHSDVVAELSRMNIFSLYHYLRQEEQGSESSKTFYLHRNETRSYHIDYAFVSSVFLDRLTMEIGRKEDWLDISDHMPLIIDLHGKG